MQLIKTVLLTDRYSVMSPNRLAFFHKAQNPFLAVNRPQIVGHDLLSLPVGTVHIHCDLLVEKLLSQRNHGPTFPLNRIANGFHFLVQPIRWDHLADQPGFQRFLSADGKPREEHVGSFHARNGPGYGDSRRRAENPKTGAGSGKSTAIAANDHIAGSHQLASGGRSQTIHPGNHRNGSPQDDSDQFGAFGEHLLVEIRSPFGRQLFQIVPGRKDMTFGGQHETPHGGIVLMGNDMLLDAVHHIERQRVTGFLVVQLDVTDAIAFGEGAQQPAPVCN